MLPEVIKFIFSGAERVGNLQRSVRDHFWRCFSLGKNREQKVSSVGEGFRTMPMLCLQVSPFLGMWS
jgi:hypothetical protein